jgi:hypothetical protein
MCADAASRGRAHFAGVGGAVALGVLAAAGAARAQACCAGAAAITPGRLILHERALAGTEVRGSVLTGSHAADGAFRAAPSGTSEWDFEQDVFGSLALTERAQASVLVPFLESARRSPTTGSEFGGGLGDVNASVRYDFVWSHEYRYVPGLALLAGVTLPTGRAPESAKQPLGSDATGLGAVQANLGVAAERSFGAWFADAALLVAKRFDRTAHGVRSGLATQFTGIAAGGYAWPQTSAALAVTYAAEGDASLDGANVPSSAKRELRLTSSVTTSLSDTLRLRGGVFLDAPLDGLGQNEPDALGLSATFVKSFL